MARGTYSRRTPARNHEERLEAINSLPGAWQGDLRDACWDVRVGSSIKKATPYRFGKWLSLVESFNTREMQPIVESAWRLGGKPAVLRLVIDRVQLEVPL